MSDQHRNDVAIIVRLPRGLRDRLAERAATEDRSVASVMRLAATSYLAHDPRETPGER